MRSIGREILAGSLVAGAILAGGASSARAQVGGSLGGYGASSRGLGMGSGGGMSGLGTGPVAPFAGRFGASMPAAMGNGGDLSFRPRPSATMSGTRTSFTIGPMVGGMGGASGRRPFVLQGGGPGPDGGGLRRPMTATGGLGVMPPSFTYPFRQPPSPGSQAAPGAGMSM